METTAQRSYVKESARVISSIDSEKVGRIGLMMAERLKRGGKPIVMGNGGSAAEAQHFVAEVMGRFEKERSPMPAIALTTNSSNITAIGNDYSYDEIFARQLKGLCKGSPNDVVVGMSTSGNSKNVVRALEEANSLNLLTVGMVGKKGKIKEMCKEVLEVDSERTSHIQEAHLAMIHMLSKIIGDST